MKKKTALVTGANRGLGKETAIALLKRSYRVLACSRNLEAMKDLIESSSSEEDAELEAFELDVASEESIRALLQKLSTRGLGCDVLINNAGVFNPGGEDDNDSFQCSPRNIEKVFQTNTLGPFILTQALLPGMLSNNYGRIVNVSSGMGGLSEMGQGFPAYRISKTALNAVTGLFASECEGKNVKVNSVCPGWVRTDMGGPSASRSIEEGIDTIVWAATLDESGPSGAFLRDRNPIPW